MIRELPAAGWGQSWSTALSAPLESRARQQEGHPGLCTAQGTPQLRLSTLLTALAVVTHPFVAFRLGYCKGLQHEAMPKGHSLSIWRRMWQWDYLRSSAEDNISLYHDGRGHPTSLFTTRTNSRWRLRQRMNYVWRTFFLTNVPPSSAYELSLHKLLFILICHTHL